MELGAAGLQQQPFRTHGDPVQVVPYAALDTAANFLRASYAHKNGLALLQGPPLSGKTTLCRQVARSLDTDVAFAIVDGARRSEVEFLDEVLSQFGYELEFDSVNERLNMIKVFALQQAASGRPPLLVLENTQVMSPGVLRALCEMARYRFRGGCAVRMVLVSDRSIEPIISAPAMQCISARVTGAILLGPMTAAETTRFLHTKLRACGAPEPSTILPPDICDELHLASGGWPGVLDRLALLALAKADACPVRSEHIERAELPGDMPAASFPSDKPAGAEALDAGDTPRLYLTLNGETLEEITLDRPRTLLGRSEHNDICIDSRFVSRHHALFIRHAGVVLLVDLNSTNGTTVNSRRVSNMVLRHDDVISLGNHGLKFAHPASIHRIDLEGMSFTDTIIMKSLEDVRRMLARDNTQTIEMDIEELRASGDTER